jgi:hypothetical protein
VAVAVAVFRVIRVKRGKLTSLVSSILGSLPRSPSEDDDDDDEQEDEDEQEYEYEYDQEHDRLRASQKRADPS